MHPEEALQAPPVRATGLFFVYGQGGVADLSTWFSKQGLRSAPYCENGGTLPRASTPRLLGAAAHFITLLCVRVKPPLSHVLGLVTLSKDLTSLSPRWLIHKGGGSSLPARLTAAW